LSVRNGLNVSFDKGTYISKVYNILKDVCRTNSHTFTIGPLAPKGPTDDIL
jgi:hypothetical protein